MEQQKRGGARPNSGRKSTGLNKQPVTVYIPQGQFYKFGGKEPMKDKIVEFVANWGNEPIKNEIQDFTKPTHEIKAIEPITDQKHIYEAKIQPKPEMAGIASVDDFQDEILATTMSKELEEVMKRVKTALLTHGAKQRLEAIAKEHSKDFFTD